MAMRFIEGELNRMGEKDLARIVAGVRGKLGRDIALPQPKKPSVYPAGSHENRPPLRLKVIPYEIEIPEVSEEVYAETRRAIEAIIPGVFITPIRSVTMEDLLAEYGQREQRWEPMRLGYVHDSDIVRATLPPAMEVFIDPEAIRIEGSNYLPADEQKREIAKIAASYRERLPEALRGNVDWHMVDPSTMSQLEDAWMDAGNGPLLLNYFARTDVETVKGHVVCVGRYGPNDQRIVCAWGRDDGDGYGHSYVRVFAVPVGVLPQKLAA